MGTCLGATPQHSQGVLACTSMKCVLGLLLVISLVWLSLGDETQEEKFERVWRNLDPPTFMTPCQSHGDCQNSDVRGAIGQYCAQFGQNKCTFKKDGNTWCYEDDECISARCYISQCTFPRNLQY